ncbi:hypothetical protein OAB57_02155, partial [Bacteriovoracaceae bacterium]|nr:hypothetical protein [Bacteriovoracaceae bacterium]
MREENFDANSWLNKNVLAKDGYTSAPSRPAFSYYDDDLGKVYHSPIFDFSSSTSFEPLSEILPLLKSIQQNVILQCAKIKQFNHSLQSKIYDDFRLFSKIDFEDLNTSQEFIDHLFDPESKYRHTIDEFIEDYAYKVTLYFFLKLRAIAGICVSTGNRLSQKDIFNPNS